eukprot:9768487-Alexandrium_andersonii.AAC.1
MAVEVSYALDDLNETGDFENFVGVVNQRCGAEVAVKHLTPTELQQVREAKHKEGAQWLRCQVVSAAAKQGLPASQLMRM